jgi:hypothetical protein
MFESWSLKTIVVVFLGLILGVGILQVFLFIYSQSIYAHFLLSFVALFLALILFHTLNIRLKRIRKK